MSAKPFGFVFLKIATCLCLWCDVPIIEKGRIKGILTSKGEAWVEVKDDLGYAHRYLAPWSGKIGAYNGSFNSEIINQINELIVGNRVSLDWELNDHLRVIGIQVIKPNWKNDLFEGYLLEIGDKWIDVQNKDEGYPWRFYLPWVGGYPQNGGGYDQSIIELLRDHKPTNPIIFEWKYELRPRIVKLFSREELSFKPFYEIDSVPPWLGTPTLSTQSGKITENKFPSRPNLKMNPFDSMNNQKAINPFDSVSQTTSNNPNITNNLPINPFEQAASNKTGGIINPFDTAINPFDNVTSGQNVSFGGVSIQKKLERLVIDRVDFNDVLLPEAVFEIIQKSRLVDSEQSNPELKGIRVKMELFGETLPKVKLSLRNKNIEEILSQLLRSVGWTYSIEEDFVIVKRKANKNNISAPSNPFDSVNPKPINPFEL